MLNYIWLGLMVAAVLIGAANDSLDAVGKAAFERAEYAVMKLALPLAGVMALWLGIMRLAEKAGLIQVLARAMRPVMRKLFPDVPPEHPAMGSMLMNMAANILGLSNAATPMGIRAMKDLETLNPRPGIASNAMCTFLAINTSSIQLIPATAVAVLAVAHATNAFAIVGTAIMATICSTIAGITSVKLLEKLPGYRLPPVSDSSRREEAQLVRLARIDGLLGSFCLGIPAHRLPGTCRQDCFGSTDETKRLPPHRERALAALHPVPALVLPALRHVAPREGV